MGLAQCGESCNFWGTSQDVFFIGRLNTLCNFEFEYLC
jgi:hypothetical protein